MKKIGASSNSTCPSIDRREVERVSSLDDVFPELKCQGPTDVQDVTVNENVFFETPSSHHPVIPPRKTIPVSRPYLEFPGIDPQKLTIGVELEMILLNMPPQTDCYKFVCGALEPLAKALGTHYLLPFTSIQSAVARSNYFQIKDDCTIFPDSILDTPIEVATPVLRNKDWVWAIPEMCRAITTAVKEVGATVSFNYSTGLHVHIAIDGRAYTLPEVKRIAKAVLLFEKRMDKRHPKCRNRANSFTTSNRDCGPLKDLSDVDALAKIDNAHNINSLICIANGWLHMEANRYRPSRCFRYNYMCLNLYGSIEFRQAIGTVCANEIIYWIKTVIKFLTAAVKTPDYLFTEWARDGVPPVVFYIYAGRKVVKDKEVRALRKRTKTQRRDIALIR